jgi:1-acyl-sn-glycerol-3-phosphate acyltransferase
MIMAMGTLRQSYPRAVLRLSLLVLLLIVMLVPVVLIWFTRLEKVRGRMVRLFNALARRICGVKLHVEGEISKLRPLMIISNHTSYLDIFILGSLLPVSFTPKLEIRSWPVIGFLAVLADCVFVERKPGDMQRAKAEMAEKLKADKVLALFPEGTTGDGFHVKPFKSGFLNLVEAHDLPLQPVSLAYTHIGDIPISAETRDQVAWIGEASLVTHMMRLLSFPCIRVTARAYHVERIAEYEDRKELAKACEHTVRTGLLSMLEANGVVS